MTKRILTIVFFLSSLTLAQLMNPKLIVQPQVHDFGNIEKGEVVSYTFILTNAGGDLLKITNVNASCGCTAANPEKNELAPGESTNLKVTFNSKGRKGKQTKHVRVSSNDAENPEITLTIKANIKPSEKVSLNSPQIYFPETQHDFGNVSEGKVVDYTFKFQNKGGSILSVDNIRTSCGCTAALVSKDKLDPGEEGTIKVELDTKNRSGKMSRTITVQSNDPREPNKVLTVYANIEKAG